MTLIQLQEKVLELDLAERHRLAEVIWESLEKEEALPLSDSKRQLLARRRADYRAEPERFLTRTELQNKLDVLS